MQLNSGYSAEQRQHRILKTSLRRDRKDGSKIEFDDEPWSNVITARRVTTLPSMSFLRVDVEILSKQWTIVHGDDDHEQANKMVGNSKGSKTSEGSEAVWDDAVCGVGTRWIDCL